MKSLPLLSLLGAAALAMSPAFGAPETGVSDHQKPPAATAEAVLARRPIINQPLTLDQAVEIGLRESPVTRGAVQEVEAAVARVAAARAELRPWASINTFVAGGSAANVVGSSDPVQPRMLMGVPGGSFFDQNVSLMVPLFTGGRLPAMVRQARALQQASQADLAAMRQEVVLMVRVAYREAQARRSFVDIYRATLAAHVERQRIDQVAYEEGKIPHFYVLRNVAEVANSQQLLTYAERDLDVSLIELKTVMGVHLDSRLELTDPLKFEPSHTITAAYTGERAADTLARAADGATEAPTLAQLLEVAARHRPELAAAARRVDASLAEVNVARSAYQPQISAGVMGDFMKMRGASPFGGTTFSVVASLPILDGGVRKARLRESRAEAKRMEEERQQVALRVGQEVASVSLNLRAAEKNVQAAQTGVTSAEEDYRVSLLRYTEGKGINLEPLDALAAQVRAQNNLVQALFDYNVAQDQLARALGMLPTPGGAPTTGAPTEQGSAAGAGNG
ncbi:MAG: TolC family protein [Armatimonadetes bacterium]|nr:TolC family protein [Armatimonadota bacterium]